MVNQLLKNRAHFTFGLLAAASFALAIVGIAAEIVFVASHLELIARQISWLTMGGITH